MPKDAVISDPRDAAKEAGLVYVNDDMPGITRQRSGKGFSYRSPDGKAITDKAGLSAKYADLQKAADGIPEAVKGGQEKVGPVVQSLGATCKGCHDTYRAE